MVFVAVHSDSIFAVSQVSFIESPLLERLNDVLPQAAHDSSDSDTRPAPGTAHDVAEATNRFDIDASDIRLEEAIGEGAFGTVYRGTCRTVRCAVKVLRAAHVDADTLAALRHEVGIMARVVHPNTLLLMGCTASAPYMIVTELMQQSVEALLFGDRKLPLALVTRLRLARDAALGMLWLHRSKPVIVHRDLKLSNLLVDEHLHCKVADFGLSQFKPHGDQFYLQDLGAGQGTIWTLAPEVMRGEPFNDKADLYLFAIVLWELVTLGEPYADFQFVRQLVEAVAVRHVRPAIPADTNARLAQLMAACWAPAARDRPDFAAVIQALEQASIEISIDDAVGRMLWAARFATVVKVAPIDAFLTQLLAVLRWPATTPPAPLAAPREIQVAVRCVRLLLGDDDNKVPIERFGSWCAFFGPLKAPWAVASPGGDLELLSRVLSLCSRNWYHGEVSSAECVRRLTARQAGTFLVRNSQSARGAFAISKVTPQGIVHLRVTRAADALTVQSPGSASFSSTNIITLVEQHSEALGLVYACPGSPFAELFEDQQSMIEGYVWE